MTTGDTNPESYIFLYVLLMAVLYLAIGYVLL